jgi:subtilisin family serine protease
MGRALAAIVLVLLALPGATAASAPATERLVSYDGPLPFFPGLRVVEDFGFAGVALVEGPVARLDALASVPGVVGVHTPEPLSLLDMDRERSAIHADAPSGLDGWPSGEGVAVAMVDSGIDATHPAFGDRVVSAVRVSRGGVIGGASGDRDGHGTHVAGIVAGDGSGSVGNRHRGLAPAAKLVAIDISDSFTTTNAVRAFGWIHDHHQELGIRVVSNSWGREKVARYDPNDPVVRASDALVADDLVVVFSAGNRGKDGASTLTPEAMNPNVVTVGASSLSGKAESYSSRGPAVDGDGKPLSFLKPDVVAPGTAVMSTRASVLAPARPGSDEERYYVAMNGTSMAAPQVAGAAAVLISAQPKLTAQQVHALLAGSARDVGARGDDVDTGHGMVDVAGAIEAAQRMLAGSTRVIVEREVPVHQAGQVVAASSQVVLTAGGAHVPPDTSVTLPLLLPPGAASVDLWLNWSGTGSFEARLVGPTGDISFDAAGPQGLHVATSAGPGGWRVDLRPTGIVSDTPYALDGRVRVLDEIDAPGAQGVVAWQKPAAPLGAFSTVTTPAEIVDQVGVLPLAMLSIAAALVAASGLVWWKRR